ncbi:MAG: DUF924 domain-containing protein [Tateyamaria sp.]|jgi:uncharacterized protein (DUF924 family)|nr:DUF924 domain-containing protein [Tateyamaria sp.]MBT5302530.1 DUF924 domain-containing protein [Tateyamaria sp.]MBT6266253.1 DUF924 domain-containing protein [Tateyamaria sp.]MBT6341958.1 DUF924 domain-containing protein [Tateyamaria sp.]MBT7448005.1 DUF924 domain-containing protein [Tateyamaria sp.]
MVGPNDILRFWLDECKPEQWFIEDQNFDTQIRNNFVETWQKVAEGQFSLWLTHPNGVLAYIILTDQLPRNMFRSDSRAFSTDRAALAAAKSAISKGWDLRVDSHIRHFFYMPLEHSENLYDQDRAVRLIHERLDNPKYLLHARAHREIIRQFGRFPHRNLIMKRKTTSVEQVHIDAGGYQSVVRSLEKKDKAA